MPSLVELFTMLRSARFLRFEAESEAATGWQGSGAGTVKVSELEADVLLFVESGAWQPTAPGRSAINFSNVFRWSAAGGLLRLEHLRFGPSEPVFLFDLTPGTGGEWRDVSPHLCRKDCYSASLTAIDHQLILSWRVVGPQKRESIRYTYW